MTDIQGRADDLLAAARDRGNRTIDATIIPPGLDHFTIYVGLIGSALELGKLIKTEERDLKVIGAYYEIQISNISSALKEVETAMLADFERDESLKAKTFESINLLIAAGQYEIASEFHKRLIDGFKRGALEAIIEHRNQVVRGGTSRLTLK